MQTRKQLFAEKRKQTAKELKAFHRDQFIRKLLKRQGLQPCFDKPDNECFRGYKAYIDKIIPVNDCAVGVVLGCGACRNSVTAFEEIRRGQRVNLPFKCRVHPNKPKFWIMQPSEKVLAPGLHLIKRAKPLYDAHGHLIEPRAPEPPGLEPIGYAIEDESPLPHIIPAPLPDTPDFITLGNFPIRPEWLEDPDAHLVDILTQAITRMPTGHMQQALINAYTHERLHVRFVNGNLEFQVT